MKNEVFEQNPNLQKVYTTSDGECFYAENDAKNHAKNLKNKTVEPVYNEKFLEVEGAEELTADDQEMADFEAAEKEAKAIANEEAKAIADAESKGIADEEAKAIADAEAKDQPLKKVK